MAQTARMKVRDILRYLQVPLIDRWAQTDIIKSAPHLHASTLQRKTTCACGLLHGLSSQAASKSFRDLPEHLP